MTPKEKALNIYAKYHTPLLNYKGGINPKEAIELQKCAKQCALIAVDELYNEIDDNFDSLHSSDRKEYWLEVSKEIINL